ncbi:metallophosphoesterase [Limnobaculum xujianqingii]|uniref:metallophosphoesterase n=1 Tax=Limnobaculum xujianqingii TaxID=2738837 RepID=UPI0011286DF2|nr:metallophosphoesterase [Limnobaculum xujianqingii]
MSEVYKKVDGTHYRNIWVVGDLHGCYQNLMGKLDSVGFDRERDLLISVGDMIDRGTQNIECLDLINEPWFMAVRGNHEQMAIDALSGKGDVNLWIANGGLWFFHLDYEQEILARALIAMSESLPLVIDVDTDNGKYIIAHADYPHHEYQYGRPVDHQSVIWNRARVSNSIDGDSEEISGAKQFIFGHTPMNQPCKFKNQFYIDTGAVFTGRLTLVQIQGDKKRAA